MNPYPNTQLDLWYSNNLSFQCTAPNTWLTNWCTDPSTWLTHQLEEDAGYEVLQFIQRWRSRAPWLQNLLREDAITSIRNMMYWCKFYLCWQIAYIINLHWVASLCITFDGPSNNPYICLGLWEKKSYTNTHGYAWNQIWNSKFRNSWQLKLLSSC